MKSIHIIVHGQVQGVYFRQHALEKAMQFEITGFVRNLPDGKVEIEAVGEHKAVESFIEWCRQGPSRAKVTQVDIHEQGLKNYSSFTIIR